MVIHILGREQRDVAVRSGIGPEEYQAVLAVDIPASIVFGESEHRIPRLLVTSGIDQQTLWSRPVDTIIEQTIESYLAYL